MIVADPTLRSIYRTILAAEGKLGAGLTKSPSSNPSVERGAMRPPCERLFTTQRFRVLRTEHIITRRFAHASLETSVFSQHACGRNKTAHRIRKDLLSCAVTSAPTV